MFSRGYSLLNFAFHSPKAQSAVLPQPKWQQLAAWRKLLAQCSRKPSRRSVHALRSLTLRLQVGLEYSLRKRAANSAAARAFQHWCKDGKKLRKALEPVRDADVHLTRLKSLRGNGKASEGKKQLSPRCIREISKLEDRLRRRRKTGINKLMAAIDARGKRLNRLSKELEAALTPHLPSRVHSTAPEALRIFAKLTSDHPRLDAGNLHEYRKRLKHARYLAEISAAADPVAKRLAAAFKRIHNAAGEWHDWQELARKANRFLASHSKEDGLIPVLEALEEKALHRALVQCRRTAARFQKNDGDARPLPPRKPVAADHGLQSEDTYLRAAIS